MLDWEKRTLEKKKEDLLESIIWGITKVKRLGFVRKCSSLQWLLSKSEGSGTNDVSDKRGKTEPANKKNSETSDLFNHHILGCNPSISHYRRSHVPNRLYISPEHNISVMFKDFCSRYQDVNISFAYYYKKKERPSPL